jgi:hypothetical protein
MKPPPKNQTSFDKNFRTYRATAPVATYLDRQPMRLRYKIEIKHANATHSFG